MTRQEEMTRQEKLAKGVRQIWNDYKLGRTKRENSVYVVDVILGYLHDNGAVLKVYRELPYCEADGEYECGMYKAGYVAVEPLI